VTGRKARKQSQAAPRSDAVSQREAEQLELDKKMLRAATKANWLQYVALAVAIIALVGSGLSLIFQVQSDRANDPFVTIDVCDGWQALVGGKPMYGCSSPPNGLTLSRSLIVKVTNSGGSGVDIAEGTLTCVTNATCHMPIERIDVGGQTIFPSRVEAGGRLTFPLPADCLGVAHDLPFPVGPIVVKFDIRLATGIYVRSADTVIGGPTKTAAACDLQGAAR
jgi:hypothetical protein